MHHSQPKSMNNTFLELTFVLFVIYSPFPFSSKLLTIFVYLQHSTQKMLWKCKIHHITLPVVSQLTRSKSSSPYNGLKGSTASVLSQPWPHFPPLPCFQGPHSHTGLTLPSLRPSPPHSRSPVYIASTTYEIHPSLLINNLLASSSHKDFLHPAYLKMEIPIILFAPFVPLIFFSINRVLSIILKTIYLCSQLVSFLVPCLPKQCKI